MVAVVTGGGLGLNLGSASVLGGAGIAGAASFGRQSDRIYVNAASGNLVVQVRDELLVGRGGDAAGLRTYNSLGSFIDDNGDNWLPGLVRKVWLSSGTANAAGSVAMRRDEDGSEAVFNWDGASGRYVSTNGAGAYDSLSFDAGSGNWTFVDGTSRTVEVYANSTGRLLSATDADGNSFLHVGQGFVKNSYDQAVAGMMNRQNSWSERAVHTVLATATLPLAAAEELVRGALNIPSAAAEAIPLAAQAGTNAARAMDSRLSTSDRVEAGLAAVRDGAFAFTGLGGAVTALRPSLEIGMPPVGPSAERMTGGLRNPANLRLDERQMQRLSQEFVEVGGDPAMLRFNRGSQTSFVDELNIVNVRGDVLPIEDALHPRSSMSSRAVLAHELGHAAHRGTGVEVGAWNDEFRASYWAARNAPGLSEMERVDLLNDAVLRAREAGVPIKMNKFMRETLYGY
ncbi:hypothetical protein LXT12_13305 [Pelomonas sp. P7]|uniref:Effector protein n=1 Tax=Pelomonas caseinilytica TaxID=2906763 RepID=A0ABS8XI41_9BURK|nr:hypothetical protein [Pelomonas sp. P7]MCE4538229.1 hypothetical protein [Pelomonas sp. P7]